MTITFYKYQGTGNDFVIIDNRDSKISPTQQQIANICDRRFGVGADGLMLLELADGYDFKMVYYNSDGRESTMCGNGGRCLVKFASHRGIKKPLYKFIAIDGGHDAEIEADGVVKLKMKDVSEVELATDHAVLNTGSPHYVKFEKNVPAIDVFAEGKRIRYSDPFKAEGINVNFAEKTATDKIMVRTYERGVENETYSCGTGVTAAALMFASVEQGKNHIDVSTPGGSLYVEYIKKDATSFEDIWLCGPAEFVFKGEIEI